MKDKSKVIINYLPQFHEIPENNKWWGKGYTDWMAVKNAKPLYKKHIQPKIPLNENYYSLDDVNTIRWQAKLARDNGAYGFAIYHYWFNSNLNLLDTPAKLILQHKDIDLNYCFIWDNATWKRTWSNVKHANDWAPGYDDSETNKKDNGILAELIYGDEKDWEIHFDYLLDFFKDPRYIKVNNKPIFGFFQPVNDFETIKKMVKYWNELAISNGFDGIFAISRDNYNNLDLEYKFRYTPLVPINKMSYLKYKLKDVIAKKSNSIRFYNYDKCWKQILKEAQNSDSNTFLSGFVTFDDTPRRGKNGRIITGATPQKFECYMRELLKISTRQNKDFVFLTAWNEWGEGCYLEPDEESRYAYLSALRKAIDND